MKYINCIFFLTFTCNIFFCQTAKLDSLQLVYNIAPNDSLKGAALKNLSWEYLNNRSNDSIAQLYIDSLLDKDNFILMLLTIIEYTVCRKISLH